MSFLSSIRSAAAKFFRRSHVEDDMEEELRSHIQHRADDLERLGLHRAEAEQRASLESAQKHIDHLEKPRRRKPCRTSATLKPRTRAWKQRSRNTAREARRPELRSAG